MVLHRPSEPTALTGQVECLSDRLGKSPVTQLHGQVKACQRSYGNFHVERLHGGLGHGLEVEVLVALPA